MRAMADLSVAAWHRLDRLLIVAVIRAVAHAHARLVVHRDLKPSNVLVTVAGEIKRATSASTSCWPPR
jgi:hypothetical protein